MRFMNLFISLFGLSASAAAFTIISPSASSYWVQFATNSISWSNSPNDPSLVSLQIINSNSSLLNGVFAISEYVPASLESYTVTNVTLIVADGYMVQMVDPANASHIFSSSSPFSVRPNGTTPAPGSSPVLTSGLNANLSGSGPANGLGGNLNRTSSNDTHSRNNTSGFNKNPSGISTKAVANSAASSVIPVFFAALLVVTSAFGLTIV